METSIHDSDTVEVSSSATDVGGIAPDRLRSFIERIENLEEDKRGISEDIKEVYAEAKGEGFDAKVMKRVVALRRMRPQERAELDELLELYLTALGELP